MKRPYRATDTTRFGLDYSVGQYATLENALKGAHKVIQRDLDHPTTLSYPTRRITIKRDWVVEAVVMVEGSRVDGAWVEEIKEVVREDPDSSTCRLCGRVQAKGYPHDRCPEGKCGVQAEETTDA